MTLKDIAQRTGGRIIGNGDIVISGVSGIKEAKEGDITFLSQRKYLPPLSTLRASALIAKEVIKGVKASILLVDNPQLAFAKVLEIFYKKTLPPSDISDKAIIGKNVRIGESVSIGAHVFIGDNSFIGSHAVIFPLVYIGSNSSLGVHSIIYPHVTIREDVIIGDRVIIHPGAVIGSDGFGFVTVKDKHHKIPQVGGVVIEDDVEIGANVTIDRATTGSTIIGSGTKIDNLVQIAHNVTIGRDCLIVAQSGISGSVDVGDSTVMGGQTGVKDHISIGKQVLIASRTGVTHNISDGQIISGFPSIPHKTWLRAQNIYSRLPEYIRRLHELEAIVKKEGSSND